MTDRHLITGACLIVLALTFLTNPLTHLLVREERASTTVIAMTGFLQPVSMLGMIGSILAIMELLRKRADLAGIIGGALALMGWTVGVRIMVLSQLESLLATGVQGVPADALERLFAKAPIVWVSIVPVGLMFPIGLIILGVTLAIVAPIPRWIGALLAIGGVLFPAGRAAGLEWAIVSCDLVLGSAFALIAWQVLARRATTPLPAAEEESYLTA